MMPLSGADVPKRVFDVVMASCLLVLLAPLLVILGLLVRVRLGAPVIFRQERPGLGGKPFTIYKFRTMIAATTTASGDALTDIQRTPSLARRMRAMSLDELPELWNVLKGDMSLVGPRPLLNEYLPLYTPEQARRHEVRPGITGLAQVRGRNAISWEEKFALDVAYVDGHDMRMDVDILIETVRTVISREGVSHGPEIDMPWFKGSSDTNASEKGDE
jgi:lipopolysaccharide/colanic/teichoic acid biosynthesis glycosyltransferase